MERSGAVEVGAVFPILKRDGTVLDLDDAAIGDGDLEDVRSQVFERGVASTDGLGVHIPVQGP